MKKRESSMMSGAGIMKIKETGPEMACQASCGLNMRPLKEAPKEPSPVESQEFLDSEPQLPETLEIGQVAEEQLEKYCVPYFTSALFATVLEDTISSLRVLSECNSHMRIWKTLDDMPTLRNRKHGVGLPSVTDELAAVDPRNLTADTYKLSKFHDDRHCVFDMVAATYQDLSLRRGFRRLRESARAADDHQRYIRMLTDDEATNKMLLRESRRQLRQQRVYFKKTVYDLGVKIEDLILQTEDVNAVATLRSNVAVRWQGARAEQLAESVRRREAPALRSIATHKRQYEHEQRAHSEMEMIVNILIDESLQEIEHWMEKYETDMEEIDLKIQIRKGAYQDVLEKRQHIQHTIEHHDKEIKGWIKFKHDREEALEYKRKMQLSATMVQAWWRGMLVRHQLGPYRPRRGRGRADRRPKSTITI